MAGFTFNMDVRAHITRSTCRYYPTPLVVASSGQEWQFHISTVRAHIGRSSGRFNLPLECKASWDVYYGII